MMDDEEAELRNPFPSPPSHYTKYSAHNLNLLSLLRERALDSSDVNQHEILSDQADVPDWPLTQLEKPRVDWILDEPDAYYDVFDTSTQVKEKIPSLAELGGNQLYPVDPTIDRRPALLGVLHSLLVAFSSLTSSLLAPPPSPASTIPPEWHRHVEWITVLSQNIMAAANDLRPVQARGNLESMMRRQVELRKRETEALHSKCDLIQVKLAELRKSIGDLLPNSSLSQTFIHISAPKFKTAHLPNGLTDHTISAGTTVLTQDDVLRWAEEVG